MSRRLVLPIAGPLIVAAALLGVLRARPGLTALSPAVDTGFRLFAVVCAAGMLLARLLAPPTSDRQPNWPETLVVVTGILLEAGDYPTAGSLPFIGGMAGWLIRYLRMGRPGA